MAQVGGLSLRWRGSARSRTPNSKPKPKPKPTQVRAQPHTLLGDVSPASFAFMMAEQLRIHYQADG